MAAFPLVVEMPLVFLLPLLFTTTAVFDDTVFALTLALTLVSMMPFRLALVPAVFDVLVLPFTLELVDVSELPQPAKRAAAVKAQARTDDLVMNRFM
jgi:hypothetical protein